MLTSQQSMILLLGCALIAMVCFDVFQTVIVPRLTLRKFRIAPILVGRILWPLYRWITKGLPDRWRIGCLEVFAPLAFIFLLATWLLSMIGGFALIIYSLGDYVRPPVREFSQALYFAGTSVLTLGFGDVVAAAWPSRVVVLLAAVLGLIFMALVVSLLFSMLSYLQQREQVVNTLTSRAGLPASGVVVLMRYRELNIVGNLSSAFVGWELWIASILESHRSFPLLMYFRSTAPDSSWLGAVGATMDAATLLLTSIEHDWIGEADLYYWMGLSVVKSIAENFGIDAAEETVVQRQDYVYALELLSEAGYKVKSADVSWPSFAARRSAYMQYLYPLAQHFEIPMHVWLPNFKTYSLTDVPAGQMS